MDPFTLDDASQRNRLRLEIAAAAARLVADEGLDYAQAKQRGAREVLGNRAVPRNGLPSNDELERALLEHLQLFDPLHEQRVAQMRRIALDWMRRLERFNPLACGAAWKGIATEFALIHLQLFYDNGKEVQFFLLDKHVNFECESVPHFKGGGDVEAYRFAWDEHELLLSVYDEDDIKGALLRTVSANPATGAAAPAFAERGNYAALLARAKGEAL